MSSVGGLRAPAGVPTVHPEVLRRRIRDLGLTGLTGLVPAVTAIAVTIGLPKTSLVVALGIIAALTGIVVLMVYPRLEITVAVLIFYLGAINGPVKLFFGGRELTASIQDLLILAVAAGALMRLAAKRERVGTPALSGWVLAWVVLVLVNAFNPRTENILHVLGGFRQLLQYVPFFYFGYALMRSKESFRKLFILAGVLATMNGVVAAYQTGLSPSQLASWGPGYALLIHPVVGTGRVYFSEGEARVRPPGLGSEAGFSGSVGNLALPMCLALLVISRRKRWLASLLCVGSIIGIGVGLGRLELIGSALGVASFMMLAALAGQRFGRTILTLFAVIAITIPVGVGVVSVLRPGTFKRYETISTGSGTVLHKESSWSKIPKYALASPFGFGLGNSGATASLGGHANNLLEGHGLTSETQYNVLVKELGVPGLLLWPALVIFVTLLIIPGMRRIKDGDLAICLAGTLAAFTPQLIEGFSGFVSGSTIAGPYFWFSIGVVAYWFGGRRSRLPVLAPERNDGHAPAPA